MLSLSEKRLLDEKTDRIGELVATQNKHQAAMEKVMAELRHTRRDLKLLSEAYTTAKADLHRALGWIDCAMNVPPGSTHDQDGVNTDGRPDF